MKLNGETRMLILIAGLLFLFVGLNELLTEESDYMLKAAAWRVLFEVVPEAAWDVAFVVVGLLGLVGVWNCDAARLMMRAGAALVVMWGVSEVIGWQRGYGSTLYSALFNFFTAFLLLGIAGYVLKEERLQPRIKHLADKVDAVVREHLRVGRPEPG